MTTLFSPEKYTKASLKELAASEFPMICGEELSAHDAKIKTVVAALKKKFSRFILFGVGGSSLGGQVIQACCGSDAITFVENIDPQSMATLLAKEDFSSVGIIVVSKSGHTPETIAQLLTVDGVLRAQGFEKNIKDIVFLSVDEDTPLRRYARNNECAFIPHDPDIGGRFSVFSSTGSLVAAILDFDMHAFRSGAREAVDQQDNTSVSHFLMALESGITNHVCMYYGDHLRSLAKWYRQLWSESLGKDGKGYELSLSRGVVDQHSQLQLYLDGPKTNYFTLLTAAKDKSASLPKIDTTDPALAFLKGHTITDLFYAEELSTYQELAKKGLYVRRIVLPQGEKAWGRLCGQLMVEVIALAHEFGVDPFNQPAVESGKIRTREILRAN